MNSWHRWFYTLAHLFCFVMLFIPILPKAAIVEFVDTMYSVVENEGKVQVCLRLRGSIGSSVVVQLIASPQTAQGEYRVTHFALALILVYLNQQ